MTPPTHITTSGGLISAAFIENVREPGSRQRGVEPEAFALPWQPAPASPAALEDTIATAWELLLERWDAVRSDLPLMEVSQVRSRWLLPLFQLLGFDPVYQRGDTVPSTLLRAGLDEEGKLRFPLSHRGWPVPSVGEGDAEAHAGLGTPPVLHTVSPQQKLDERSDGSASTGSAKGIKAKSPHDVVQAFLNASPDDGWAIVSNGVLLRLLRDYHHTFTKGYVQFDLESILETRNYGDFRALYRLCHVSRFLRQGEDDEAILPLEQFYKDSIATGIKVGEDLRGQVRQAIETLGNGFLDAELISLFTLTPESPISQFPNSQTPESLLHAYYAEILHIIYRILFLLFAEQRGMMPGRDSLYAETYAIARLRGRAEGDLPREDDFTDLWEGLKVTFRLVRQGAPALGVFGYDGMLFEDHAVGAHGRAPLLDGRAIRNSELLRAVRTLTLVEREGVLQRISYADLGVEELGSIYESLLDYTPRVTLHAKAVDGPSASLSARGRELPPHTFYLDPRGSERKTTGSYYTHPSLVNELIKSALLPVARARLAAAGLPVVDEEAIGEATAGLLADYAGLSAEQRQAGEEALLALKVCDPAAGSGHFLVKANNTLGAELARLRTGDEYPAQDEVQAAKRDVLAHCIHAVDLNPMAVELCKVSLWINASVRDRPLSFLDHHIKCGNSLIGATPALMADGIPYEAFDQGMVGNDRKLAVAVRKRNRQERSDFEAGGAVQLDMFAVTMLETMDDLQRWSELTRLAQDRPQAARERYEAYQADEATARARLLADTWTAAFFWPITEDAPDPPTFDVFRRVQAEGRAALTEAQARTVAALAEQYRFFHWHLEFRDVFGDDGGTEGDGGGFDVVLGNPPWERIKLQEKEFFAGRDAEIANARTAAARRRLIRNRAQTNPGLHADYRAALRESEATSHFLRASDRFPLTAGGDINTYAVFTGLAQHVIAPEGRAGLVVPTGIATDYTYRDFFADVVESEQLASLYDFENRRGLFPEVDSRMKFSLLTLMGGGAGEADFAFFLHTTSELADPERRFPLDRDDLRLINPNTRTVPVFRTRQEARLTHRLYRAAPVLVNEDAGTNPWHLSLGTLFHSGSASSLFRSHDELQGEGFSLGVGNRFAKSGTSYLPLYEGKMFMGYDHRAAQIMIDTKNIKRAALSGEASVDQKRDPTFYPLPRFWVDSNEVQSAIPDSPNYLVGFKKVTSPTNERTLLATILPLVAANDSIHFVFFPPNAPHQSRVAFLASLNSMALDFVARQKLGGLNFNFWVFRQLPVLAPDRYTPDLLDFIVPRVVELAYTAWDLQPFAADVLAEVGPATWARWFETDHLGSPSPVHTSPPPAWATGDRPAPFVWDEARRARLRAELDAVYAHLYGLTREELAYILDTFPIVRRKDEARWGEYRTKRMVLEKYEDPSIRGIRVL